MTVESSEDQEPDMMRTPPFAVARYFAETSEARYMRAMEATSVLLTREIVEQTNEDARLYLVARGGIELVRTDDINRVLARRRQTPSLNELPLSLLGIVSSPFRPVRGTASKIGTGRGNGGKLTAIVLDINSEDIKGQGAKLNRFAQNRLGTTLAPKGDMPSLTVASFQGYSPSRQTITDVRRAIREEFPLGSEIRFGIPEAVYYPERALPYLEVNPQGQMIEILSYG